VCLDEIQRLPESFPALRSVLDRSGKNGRIMVLGSASGDLLRQTSESLAGRISYIELSPFSLSEVRKESGFSLRTFWLRGGYPRSYIAGDNEISFQWRRDFITTFLERDIPQFGIQVPAMSIRRLWTMCAHLHGQVLNNSKLGDAMGVSHNTARSYIDILEKTFMVRVLPPFAVNLKKRTVKSPKMYIRDAGILHGLLDIAAENDLLGHPVCGASWEGFCLENILTELPNYTAGFYRSSSGSEIDLVLEKGRQRIAVEFKASTAPVLTGGFWNAMDDLDIKKAWIIAPVNETFPVKKNVHVAPLHDFLTVMKGR